MRRDRRGTRRAPLYSIAALRFRRMGRKELDQGEAIASDDGGTVQTEVVASIDKIVRYIM